MTYEDYLKKKKELRDKYHADDIALDKMFAFANTTIQIGDYVRNSRTMVIIKVEKISSHVGLNAIPQCVYEGPTVKTDLSPTKKAGRATFYQSNTTLYKKG